LPKPWYEVSETKRPSGEKGVSNENMHSSLKTRS